MQRRFDFSELRKELIALHQGPASELGAFLLERPMMKGTVYAMRRKCSKVSCRCARGELHETMMLSATVGGKTRLWTIPEGRLGEIRELTQRYRYFRQARREVLKALSRRAQQIGRVLDGIERMRTETL